MSIIAIIPARSGSKGVPGKNINLLSGFPLIAYSIAVARLVPKISRIIVSTDSQEYADIANKYGAETPFIRPSEISGDKSSDLDFMLHAIKWFKENEGKVPTYFMHLRPTTPIREPDILNNAINEIINAKEATSLRSGHSAQESPFKWFLKDEQGYFKGLRDDLTPEKVNLPRQVFPQVYVPDGYVDIIKSDCVIESNTLHGNRMKVFESPFCTEIDTLDDFKYLEYQLTQTKPTIFKWLKENY
ncbi:MAG: acylneuraminate cytidylyltransferase family protein [Bacteroidetes bacterium]|nr:acylneuraminate cytidylyltransferase family protein [Bacteroidota bacterium]